MVALLAARARNTRCAVGADPALRADVAAGAHVVGMLSRRACVAQPEGAGLVALAVHTGDILWTRDVAVEGGIAFTADLLSRGAQSAETIIRMKVLRERAGHARAVLVVRLRGARARCAPIAICADLAAPAVLARVTVRVALTADVAARTGAIDPSLVRTWDDQ